MFFKLIFLTWLVNVICHFWRSGIENRSSGCHLKSVFKRLILLFCPPLFLSSAHSLVELELAHFWAEPIVSSPSWAQALSADPYWTWACKNYPWASFESKLYPFKTWISKLEPTLSFLALVGLAEPKAQGLYTYKFGLGLWARAQARSTSILELLPGLIGNVSAAKIEWGWAQRKVLSQVLLWPSF